MSFLLHSLTVINIEQRDQQQKNTAMNSSLHLLKITSALIFILLFNSCKVKPVVYKKLTSDLLALHSTFHYFPQLHATENESL